MQGIIGGLKLEFPEAAMSKPPPLHGNKMSCLPSEDQRPPQIDDLQGACNPLAPSCLLHMSLIMQC